MAELDINATTTPTILKDFNEPTQQTDGVSESGETFYSNENFPTYYGHYNSKTNAKIKISLKAYATWVVGKGWTADNRTTATLDNITGWGEDTFLSILWNMLVIKKVNGDSYAEIMRNDEGTLINIKPLSPSNIRIVIGKDGIIDRYEFITRVGENTKVQKIPVQRMLHFSNDRVANNIHGDSVIESLQWNIEAQEEARKMFRKKVKNSGILGIIESDTDNTTKTTNLKPELKKGMEEGTLLMIPKGVLEAKPFITVLNTQEILSWLNHLDDEFFMMIGQPKVILGGSSENEGDKKMSYLSHEQFYMRSITELKADLWNQLAIRVEFTKPASLQNQLADNELKNTSQVGLQPNDTTAGVGE